jgi:hypothetical protein
MYYLIVAFTTVVIPVGSILVEGSAWIGTDLVSAAGKRFVFWAIGVRVVLAWTFAGGSAVVHGVRDIGISDPGAEKS